MSSQSILAQIKSARISRNVLFGLSAGLALGLILGLMIGWVWWPVEYTGGSISNLPAPEQAVYLSAVADAYVAAGSPEAAAMAQERLTYFSADLAVALDAAIAYYAAQPDSGVRVSNLVALAAAVGSPVDVQNNPALAGATAPVFSGASAAGATAAAQAAPPAPAQGGNLLAWLLTMMVAVVLIGGGVYVAWWYLSHRMQASAARTADLEDLEEKPTSYAVVAAAPVRVTSTAAAGSGAGSGPSRVTLGGAADAGYGFEHEEDEASASQFTRTATLYYARPDQPPVPTGAAGTPLADEDDFVEEGDAELAADAGAEPDADLDDEWGADAGNGGEVDVPPAVLTAQKNSAGIPAPSPLFAARQDRYVLLDSYTAIYTAGMVDFDHTQNVANPQGAGYIGEYGFGIANRHGVLNNNLEQVVALEVYLFDKSEETAPLTTSRTLLSEYAHDKMFSLFEREKQGGGPIIAQPRTRFQLEGRQLLLDCVIANVTYTREGIFQAVTVEMTLKRRV